MSIESLLPQFEKIRDSFAFSAFDVTTAEGRSKERHRRAVLTALASLTAKVILVASSLISVPLTLSYLGSERFGMWVTISSVSAMLGFADFGIGNGVLTSIARANGRDDRSAMQAYVSSGFFILTVIAISLGVLFATVYRFVPWAHVFNTNSPLAVKEAGAAAAVFFFCFVMNIPADIVQRVEFGLQNGFIASIYQCIGNLLGLCSLLVAIHLHAGLPWLVLALAGSPVLAYALNGFVFFGCLQPSLRPKFHMVSGKAIRQVMQTGVLFLVLQVVVAVAYASDYLIIAQILGPSTVTQYAVPEKMFSAITVLLTMALAPLWPAYGEAISRGDIRWVRRTIKRSVIASVFFASSLSTILIVFGPQILSAWIHHHVAPPFILLIGLGIWKVMEAIGNSLSVFLNGAHIVRTQVVIALLTAVSAVALKIILIHRMGFPGVIWASIVAWTAFSLLPLAFLMPRIVSKLNPPITEAFR